MSYARIALNMNEFAEQEKQALLTKLREEVEEQKYWMMKHETLYNVREYETGLNIFDGLLALLEKAGE